MNKIVADVDGTVLQRWEPGFYDPIPNPKWRNLEAIALLSNQGGVPLKWCGFEWAQKYPDLDIVLHRIAEAVRISRAQLALVVLFHPKQLECERGVRLAEFGKGTEPLPVHEALKQAVSFLPPNIRIGDLDPEIAPKIYLSFNPNHRKPKPDGLLWIKDRLGLKDPIYIGDEDSDREAALAAGYKFLAIEQLSGDEMCGSLR